MLNETFNKKLTIIVTGGLLLFSQMSFAQALGVDNKLSHSIGGQKHSLLLADNKTALIQQSENTARTLAYKGMNRTDVKVARLQEVKTAQLLSKKSVKNNADSSISSRYGFSIYTGFSQLLDDIDGDGYYQAFSVTFDADILSPVANEQALVYADLYLSENGGPWQLYFSTDDFVITGEDSDDEFEVITRLDSGYVPTQYDVLIDLYEVGYSDVVATYSSDDTNDLYALPLESADYDPEYIEVEYYEEHGGSSSWLLFSTILLLIARRR